MSHSIMIIAGEASGDLHGGPLVKAIKEKSPNTKIFGIGGDRMKAEGMELYYHVNDLAYVGFTEVAKHYFFFRCVFNHMANLIKSEKPDVVVLIDYPGFNLRFAKKAKSFGVKTFYYIAPQVWAWGQGRAKKMAKYIDRMGLIFEFEVPFFKKYGIEAEFVGHPLLDGLKTQLTKDEFCRRFNLNPNQPILALLPGSRHQEIENLLPTMLETARELLKENFKLQIAVSKATTVNDGLFTSLIQNETIIAGSTYDLIKHATAAIVASGTATLETALFETPFVIVYKVSPLSYFIGKKLIKIDSIGLVNVVSGEKIIPEFIQNDVKVDKIMPVLKDILFEPKKRKQQKQHLKNIRSKLGSPGGPAKAADAILALTLQ